MRLTSGRCRFGKDADALVGIHPGMETLCTARGGLGMGVYPDTGCAGCDPLHTSAAADAIGFPEQRRPEWSGHLGVYDDIVLCGGGVFGVDGFLLKEVVSDIQLGLRRIDTDAHFAKVGHQQNVAG